ncbi:hypothetical protein ACEWY4_001475 [Coilia grayii]|uniref:C1q domain-containing protein n=1 Tax=Coilia grayii TaxID=363190 RepID=A0ABD1KT15_9TELE
MRTVVVLVCLCASAAVADLKEILRSPETAVQPDLDVTVQKVLEDQDDVPSTTDCPPDPCRLQGQVGSMVTRLVAGEKMIKELRAVVKEQASMLTQQKASIEELTYVVTQQKSAIDRLNFALKSANEAQSGAAGRQRSVRSVSESKAEELMTEVTVSHQPKMAFTASLYSSGDNTLGPLSGDTNIVFRNVITNVGDAYSPTTGIFKAPHKGVYYFRFTAFNIGKDAKRVALLKNGNAIVTVTDNQSSEYREESSSNAAVLELNIGDEVNLVLRADHSVYDDEHHHTTFSGFLLFTQP